MILPITIVWRNLLFFVDSVDVDNWDASARTAIARTSAGAKYDKRIEFVKMDKNKDIFMQLVTTKWKKTKDPILFNW